MDNVTLRCNKSVQFHTLNFQITIPNHHVHMTWDMRPRDGTQQDRVDWDADDKSISARKWIGMLLPVFTIVLTPVLVRRRHRGVLSFRVGTPCML